MLLGCQMLEKLFYENGAIQIISDILGDGIDKVSHDFLLFKTLISMKKKPCLIVFDSKVRVERHCFINFTIQCLHTLKTVILKGKMSHVGGGQKSAQKVPRII